MCRDVNPLWNSNGARVDGGFTRLVDRSWSDIRTAPAGEQVIVPYRAVSVTVVTNLPTKPRHT